MYLQTGYKVMFDVGAITSGGEAIFEYGYKKSIFHLQF